MYINAVAYSVMLYLRHDFYKIIFKIKRKLYIAPGSASEGKILGAPTGVRHTGVAITTIVNRVVCEVRALTRGLPLTTVVIVLWSL
jgi:hypothetical protein